MFFFHCCLQHSLSLACVQTLGVKMRALTSVVQQRPWRVLGGVARSENYANNYRHAWNELCNLWIMLIITCRRYVYYVSLLLSKLLKNIASKAKDALSGDMTTRTLVPRGLPFNESKTNGKRNIRDFLASVGKLTKTFKLLSKNAFIAFLFSFWK